MSAGRWLVAMAALVFGWNVALAGEPQKRVALVIGNGAYTAVPRLPNPPSDAAAIGQALRDVGFTKVTVVTDLTHQGLFDALRRFSDESVTADWSVLYYAGHGVEVDGKNYLVPIDAHLAVDRDVQFETVPMETVLAAVGGARKLRLVILDACRDNPFLTTMRRSTTFRSASRGLARVEPEGRLYILYSAQSGQVARDGEGEHSPFVKALLKNIETPGVELNLVIRKVQDEVEQATNEEQSPSTEGKLPGEELYFRPPLPVAAAAPPSLPEVADRTITVEPGPKAPEAVATKPPRPPESPPVAPVVTATLEQPPIAPRPAPADDKVIALAVQNELRRVGCDAGPSNGQWTVRSRMALLDFSQHANLNLDVDKPDEAALKAVRSQRGIVCPPVFSPSPRPGPPTKRASLEPVPPRHPVAPRRPAPQRVVQGAEHAFERVAPARPFVPRPTTPRPAAPRSGGASCFVFNGERVCE